MMKNEKKRLALLLAVLLLCSAFLPAAFAADGRTGGKVGTNITWQLSGQTLTLSGTGELSLDWDALNFPWETHKDLIKKLVIKEGITRIPDDVFREFSRLSALTVPKSLLDFPLNTMLKTPWYQAQKNGPVYLNGILCGFKGKMPANYTLKIKDGTKAVASGAFEFMKTLRAVRIPDSVVYIGGSAFYDCDHLSNIRIPARLRYVGSYAFARSPWLNNRPAGVVYLGKIAYCVNGNVSEKQPLKLKNGTTAIAPNAFYGCEDLTQIRIPDTVTTIGYDAFHTSGIETLVIPKSVKTIEGNKVGARFMKKIIVDPANPVYSSDKTGALFNKKKTQLYEFPGANKAKTYQIPNTVTFVQGLCFDGAHDLETLSIPASVRKLESDAVHGSEALTAFRVAKKNPNYACDAAGCLYNKDKTTLLRYPVGKTDKTFIVPKQVKTIGSSAFLQAGSLETLKMYDNVTSIGAFALYRCYNLKTIRFSKNIRKVGAELFSYLPWLDQQPDVVYIGKVLYMVQGNVKNLVVKTGTVSVADYACAGLDDLQSVVLPKSVTSVGHGAFSNAAKIKTIRILNPKCSLPMEAELFPPKATVCGADGSTAQAYAKVFGRKFVAV